MQVECQIFSLILQPLETAEAFKSSSAQLTFYQKGPSKCGAKRCLRPISEQTVVSFQTPSVFLLLTEVVGCSYQRAYKNRSLWGLFSLREEQGLGMQMTELQWLLQLAVAHSFHGFHWRVAADRSWTVGVANSLSHLVHPSELPCPAPNCHCF